MNQKAKMLYMNLSMRINDYQKVVDNIHISLSERNNTENIITGLIIAKHQLINEFSLDYKSIDKRIEEIRTTNK